MAKIIIRICRRINAVFDIRSLSLDAGGCRYVPPKFSYPSTEEAWRTDWENIGKDFRRSAARLTVGLNHG